MFLSDDLRRFAVYGALACLVPVGLAAFAQSRERSHAEPSRGNDRGPVRSAAGTPAKTILYVDQLDGRWIAWTREHDRRADRTVPQSAQEIIRFANDHGYEIVWLPKAELHNRALSPGTAVTSRRQAAQFVGGIAPEAPGSGWNPDAPVIPNPKNGVRLAQAQAAPSVQPPAIQPAPVQPAPEQPAPSAEAVQQVAGAFGRDIGELLGSVGSAVSAQDQATLTQENPNRGKGAATPGATVLGGAEAPVRSSIDAGDLLGKSQSATGLTVQRRNPISTDPRIRGYHVGEIMTVADDAYWFPARQDLDTMLSKLDSSIIRDVITIKGPYSARYGPGFAFLDIETIGTPRYQNGFEWHGRTALNYQTNGEQWYGRQSIWAGDSDWGFRASEGIRSGSDYFAGTGDEIPSSYKMRDLDTAVGMDLTPNSHLEFGYLRLDETDTEYPGQVFDIDFLVTDGFNLRYVVEDQPWFDRFTVDTWYNRTRFEGNAQGAAKRRQLPELNRPLNFIGFTDVDEMSTGFRAATTWGLPDEPQLTFGVDLRYLGTEINERDAADAELFFNPFGNLGIPESHSSNPGLFLEGVLPVDGGLTVTAGTRVDWVSTNIEDKTLDGAWTPSNLAQVLTGNAADVDFDRDFQLFSAFITAEQVLTDAWVLRGGAGYAERPPTLTELYAVDPFLAILQQGFTQVRGNPNLDPERLWQIDLGLHADYPRFRGGITGFHAWVKDYITYFARNDTLEAGGVDNGLAVNFTNTDLATLAGAELYGEYDLLCCLTPFATFSYVEGRDHSRDNRGNIGIFGEEEPLPQISPLESRLGLRFHEPVDNPRWGIEFAARVVDNQDRIARSLREQETPGFTTYDLRSYWQVSDSLLVLAGVENFTDKRYQEHLDLRTGNGVFRPGVNFYFGAELEY